MPTADNGYQPAEGLINIVQAAETDILLKIQCLQNIASMTVIYTLAETLYLQFCGVTLAAYPLQNRFLQDFLFVHLHA